MKFFIVLHVEGGIDVIERSVGVEALTEDDTAIDVVQ